MLERRRGSKVGTRVKSNEASASGTRRWGEDDRDVGWASAVDIDHADSISA